MKVSPASMLILVHVDNSTEARRHRSETGSVEECSQGSMCIHACVQYQYEQYIEQEMSSCEYKIGHE